MMTPTPVIWSGPLPWNTRPFGRDGPVHLGGRLPPRQTALHADVHASARKFQGTLPNAAEGRGDVDDTCEQLRGWVRDGDMDARRVPVMRDVLRAKFADPELRRRLQDTGDALLVERLLRSADAQERRRRERVGETAHGGARAHDFDDYIVRFLCSAVS